MRSVLSTLLLLSCLSTAPCILGDEEATGTLSYYQIKPSLVANLVSGGKYIRTDIQLMTKDESYMEQFELHDPAIRHTLLLLLSDQDGKQIGTPDGKEALRQAAMTQLNDLLQELTGQTSLEGLFFTTFFVQ
jgi:flagellar FliL protein